MSNESLRRALYSPLPHDVCSQPMCSACRNNTITRGLPKLNLPEKEEKVIFTDVQCPICGYAWTIHEGKGSEGLTGKCIRCGHTGFLNWLPSSDKKDYML